METSDYIISFGNSTKYRLTADNNELRQLKGDIRNYLASKYPDLPALGFFDKMTVTPIDASNKDEYKDYKEFNADSLSEIKKVLSVDIDGLESLDRLNSNAPWGIGAEK